MRHISDSACPWIFLQDGTVYGHPWLLQAASVNSLLITCCRAHAADSAHKNLFPYDLDRRGLGGLVICESRSSFVTDILRGRLDDSGGYADGHVAGVLTAISERHIPKLGADVTDFIRQTTPTCKQDGWWIYAMKSVPDQGMYELLGDLHRSLSHEDSQSIPFYARLFLNPTFVARTSIITKYLSAVGFNRPIPYNAEERGHRFPKAFRQLRRYIEIWRQRRNRDSQKRGD